MITAGYPPEFVRWGCTIRDFKMFLLAAMKDRIEEQQNFSLAMMVAVASVFDGKASKDVNQQVQQVISKLDTEQNELYDAEAEIGVPTAVNTPRSEKKDPSGLSESQVKLWKNAAAVDAVMAKMTGRPTGAPWSLATQGNLTQGFEAFKGQLQQIDGDRIMRTMESMRSRLPVTQGRNRAQGVKPKGK